jgi:hypothetical protein
MGKKEHGGHWWSLPLVVATLGCGPSGSASLDAGLDETGGDEGSGGSGSESGGSESGGSESGGSESGGSESGDDSAPQLLSAWTDETGKYIVLRFSEPMAPPDDVDPSDFRISHAKTTDFLGGGPGSNYTMYRDPHILFWEYYYEYGDPPTMPSVITSVTAGELATDLVLEFAVPLPLDACDILEQEQALIANNIQFDVIDDGRVGLYPHYSQGSPNAIRSAQDEPLESIGEEWVLLDGIVMSNEEFGFPNLVPQIPIDCLIGQ